MRKFLVIFLAILFLSESGLRATETREEIKPHSAVILGGGVGALTAATYLQRGGVNTLVIEGKTPGGAISQSPTVHNWPGEIEINGQVLIQKIRNQALANGATIVSEEVIHADFSKRPFSIITRDIFDHSQTRTIQAETCLIATGSNPRLLGIPGESGDAGYWTRGVHSCAVCDGQLYSGKTVAVIGGGDTAILEAEHLSKTAKTVYVILRSSHFRTVENVRKQELIKRPNVQVLYDTQIKEIIGDGKQVTHLELSDSTKLSVDGVFLAIGAIPNSKVFATQLALDEQGYIRLTHGQQTSIPGVFAFGDVVDPLYKQAISAAGDGAKAALQAEHYLALAPTTPQKQQQPVIFKTANPSGIVEEIVTKDAFYDAIGNGSIPLLVEFYSPYCGPCRQLSPKLDTAAKVHQGKIRFLKVNITQFSELASSYNIYALPTILVFDNQGKMVKQASGLTNAEALLQNDEFFTHLH